MENQIFSFSRFGAYLMKYFSEYRALRLQFIILTATLAVLMSMTGSTLGFFSLSGIMYIFAIITASKMSILFSTRVNKIKFLMTPVSQFEKLLAMVFHLYIYIPVMFAVSILIAQYCATLLTALMTFSMPEFAMPYDGIGFEWNMVGAYFLSYCGASAFYLMGATLFTRHTFLKTTGLSLVLGFILVILVSVGMSMHIFSRVALNEFNDVENILTNTTPLMVIFSVVITLLYLGVAYLRITEMEANETRK